VTLALMAVGTAAEGDRKLYVVGGRELDREFLSTLVLPAGMRVLLYRNLAGGFAPSQLIDAGGPAAGPALLRPLIEQVLAGRRESFGIVGSGAAAESFHAVPLPGLDNSLLGVLLIASARRDLVELENSLVRTGAMVAAAGILLGILLSWWAAARVTRPVRGPGGGGRLERHGGYFFRRRDRATGGGVQQDDAGTGGAARAPGAGREGGGMA
jgi:hypothetical protein